MVSSESHGGSGGPSLDSLAAHDQLNRRDRDGISTGAYNDELAVAGESIHQGGMDFESGAVARITLGAAELLEILRPDRQRRYPRSAWPRAFFARRFFIFSSSDGESAEAHLAGILDSQMAESADALNCYQIAGARARVAERVENRDAGAQQWRGLGGGKFFRNGGYRFGGHDHVFLITAVVTDAGNLFVLAVDEIAAAAGIAGEVVAAVPSDSDALAGFPVGNVGADSVDAAGDFVSGDSWILDAGPIAFLYERVAVADAAGFDFNSDLVSAGLGNVSSRRVRSYRRAC